MDRIIATIPPDEVESALRLLALFESHGRIDPAEAEEWRLRTTA